MNSAIGKNIVRKARNSNAVLRAVLAATIIPVAVFAQEAEIVSVAATGYGASLEAAKKAAARAAIEQVAGQLVDAETLVENDAVVKDRILTYSGAVLEDIDVVGKPTQEDGLWTVKVLAKVRKTTLRQKLAAENVGSKATLKKGKLFAQATSKAQEAADAGAMLAAAFKGFPRNVVKFEVCKNADGTPAVSVSSADGHVAVTVELSFAQEAWKAWSSALILKLEKMASGRETARWHAERNEENSMGIHQDGKRLFLEGAGIGIVNRWGHQDSSKGFRFAVAPAFREGATSFQAREYVFAGNNEDIVRAFLWKSLPQGMELIVSLMADDEMLESKTWSLRTQPGVAFFSKWGGSALYSKNFSPCMVPAFCDAISLQVKYRQSVRFTLDLGKLPASFIEDATDVVTSVRFLVPDDSGHNSKLVPMKE